MILRDRCHHEDQQFHSYGDSGYGTGGYGAGGYGAEQTMGTIGHFDACPDTPAVGWVRQEPFGASQAGPFKGGARRGATRTVRTKCE